ncbi:hypothetical protein BJV82DRAFT_577826 [Fennellomyces sp. T-0311]|nr:hypothetical protein BJV82DRAFT_577826 [Fennellomyces sp. T-0311]
MTVENDQKAAASLETIIQSALGQGEPKPINQEDLVKLFEALSTIETNDTQQKQDIKDLTAMLEATKQENGVVDEELVRNILGGFLSDHQHVQELSESIGNFEIRF